MMKQIIVAIVLLASLVACRSTKKISTAITKKDSTLTVQVPTGKADTVAYIKTALEKLSANKINYTTFNAKVNIDYRGGDDKNYDVNAIIRMYKDSAIWMSANAVLGIEAIRLLITKDSVKLMNKLDKSYTARSVDYLQEVTALPLDLKTLQDLIVGNPVFLDSNVVSYTKFDGSVSLLSIGDWFKNLITVAEADHSLSRTKLDDADITHSRTADLTYSDYETKQGPLFATKRRIYISEKKKLDIRLDFKNYGFNGEVSFPFTVPKNYKLN